MFNQIDTTVNTMSKNENLRKVQGVDKISWNSTLVSQVWLKLSPRLNKVV